MADTETLIPELKKQETRESALQYAKALNLPRTQVEALCAPLGIPIAGSKGKTALLIKIINATLGAKLARQSVKADKAKLGSLWPKS
jgi:hypothetical protein